MNIQIRPGLLLVALGLAGAALAQNASNRETTQIEAPTGPVIVHSGQTGVLPNAAEYQVQIADLDRNGDGQISRQEAEPNGALSSEFKLVDRNHNGYISAAELASWK